MCNHYVLEVGTSGIVPEKENRKTVVQKLQQMTAEFG